MKDALWERVADILKEEKIDVYPPATKQGECKTNYVVMKRDGSSQIGSFSSQVDYYVFMCYVPKNKYTELEKFKSKLVEVLSSRVFPLLVPTGLETPDFYDDTVKAHMVSITYRASRRNRNL